jgi:hypothetical protein
LSVYESRMSTRTRHIKPLPFTSAAMVLLALGAGVSGCASMGDSMSSAFADPARYDLYECKQLETERKSLAIRLAEVQGLMAKAETGVAGPVVAELAYRNDYIALRGQSKLAEEAWARNKCVASAPAAAAPATPAAPPPNTKGAGSPKRSGSAVH